MKLILQYLFIYVLYISSSGLLYAQEEFSIRGEYRLNPLYSNGFRVPLHEGEKPEGYVNQRTRLLFNYKKKEDLVSEVVIQDIRAWGEQSVRKDVPSIGVFRAWAEKYFSPAVSLKLGRQGLVYDDQYILGELNWGGTLAHDAALLKYEKKRIKIHAAYSYSTAGFNLTRQPYALNNYKTMQFLWLHKATKNVKASLIFLNRGLEKPNNSFTTNYEQTAGTNLTFKVGSDLQLKTIYYHQFGKDTTGAGRTIDANLMSGQITYSGLDKLSFTAGADLLSGNDMSSVGTESGEKNNFDILYGLRHAHFGYLDYFYVKLEPETGLQDYYLKSRWKPLSNTTLQTDIHTFYSSATITDPIAPSESMDHYLGWELDILGGYKVSDNFKASIGYSKMWATDTFDAFYDGLDTKASSVMYAVIVINANFFSHKDL